MIEKQGCAVEDNGNLLWLKKDLFKKKKKQTPGREMIKKMQGFYYLTIKISLCLLWQIKKQLHFIFIQARFELEQAMKLKAHTVH